MKYQIIYSVDVGDMVTRVNELLQQGWELVGQPFVTSGKTPFIGQAMSLTEYGKMMAEAAAQMEAENKEQP